MEHNIIVKQEFDAESVSSIGLSTHAEKVKLEDETEENLVIPKDEVEYNEHMDFGAYASDVDGVSTMIKNETLDIKASPEHDDYEDSYSIETENGQQQVTDEDFTASGKFENETKKIGGDIPESSGHNHVEEPHSTRNRQQQLPVNTKKEGRKNLKRKVEATENLAEILQERNKIKRWYQEETVKLLERQTIALEKIVSKMKKLADTIEQISNKF